jgi:iron(III) transport system permease protein
MIHARRRLPLGLLIPGVVVALAALSPLWYLGDRAFSRGWDSAVAELFQRRTLDLLWRSGVIMVLSTALCTIIGVSLAVLVTRTDLPGRRVWRIVFALPLAVPTYIAAYAWISAWPSLAGLDGATLVLVACSYPYVYLPVVAALQGLDPATEETARTLGRRPLGVLWHVTLPQVRPAIASGALLVALYVLSDFGAVGTMRFESFTWVIYGAYRAGFNPARAAVLAMALVAAGVVITAAESAVRGAIPPRVGASSARDVTALGLGRMRAAALAGVSIVVGVALGFPAVSLVQWLARSVATDVAWGQVASSLGSSLSLALITMVVTVLAALPAGILAARHPSRSARLIERASFIAHALPGIVIAIAVVHVGVRTLRPLYQRTPLLIAAYVVLFLPLAVGSVRTAFEQCPPRLEEVARSLGRNGRQAAWGVAGRVALPGLAAAAALAFLATMKELPATLLLHPTGTDTLATRLWGYTTVSDYGNAAPYAAALMLFAAIPTAALGWFSGRFSGANRD